MINLPRQLIYQDRTELSDYLVGNELNQAIYDALKSIQPGSWWERLFKSSALSDEEILSMFNDAYYLCILAANFSVFRPEDYTYPNGSHVYDVWQMVIVILSLQKNSLSYGHILEMLGQESCPPFRDVLNRFKGKKQTFTMNLDLHVPHVDTLDMDWEIETRGFSKRIILDILGLWTEPEEKLEVCGQIRAAFLTSPRRGMPYMEVDEFFFDERMMLWKSTIERREWEKELQMEGLWNWSFDRPVDDWEDKRRAMKDKRESELLQLLEAQPEVPQPEEPEIEEETETASDEETPIVIEKEKKKKSIFVNIRGEENLAHRAEETARFLKYIRGKGINIDKFVIDTSAKNFVNLAFVSFFREWLDRGWVVKSNWASCYRFLRYDCGFSFSVQKKAYATFIGKMADHEYDIEDELKKITPEVKACFQVGSSVEY